MARRHMERHLVHRIGWLRAAVLGANDGVVSTASLVVGVAAAAQGRTEILLAAAAGLTAGAFSMAAGEYVSVSSQADTEHADLARERRELAEQPAFEREELAHLYAARGVDLELARKVADQLMAKDALGAHARDELGISDISTARPIQAALTSALTFSAGAAAPLIAALASPRAWIAPRRRRDRDRHSRDIGGDRRTDRRGGHVEGRPSRDVLGRPGARRHRGGRRAVRGVRLAPQREPLPAFLRGQFARGAKVARPEVVTARAKPLG